MGFYYRQEVMNNYHQGAVGVDLSSGEKTYLCGHVHTLGPIPLHIPQSRMLSPG